jgi:hypothetical protein
MYIFLQLSYYGCPTKIQYASYSITALQAIAQSAGGMAATVCFFHNV